MSERLLETRVVNGRMPTTRWSLVRAAGSSVTSSDRRRALELLSRDYWPPIYSFIRTWGHPPEEAEDLTQSFLVSFIERESFGVADVADGRFRSWLLAALKNFLLNDKRDRSRLKRGGGIAHVSIDRDLGEAWFEEAGVDGDSPDTIFERHWAAGILERCLTRLEERYRQEGKAQYFEILMPLIAGSDDRGGYARAGAVLELTEGSARSAAFRLRKRLRAIVRDEIAATLADKGDLESEIDHFYDAFRSR
ncbi:RNA polymerase sigma factor [Luteolibacter marinus]|uniref:RNA polymerase sigma factor n=1 Tax=Luteolibacter marinus TaxID=2776705 RepID=UPI0018670DE7|nr:sigma-70 family RNA polymerase sigma factor [Luteolibacter marinus]